MLLNYLKVALRNIRKYKAFSFINVFGLAAAMSICMLILLMLADQQSYDQFNVNRNNTYRILCDKPDLRHPYATSPFPLATKLKTEIPAVKDATCLLMGVGGDAQYNQQTTALRGYFADTSFFNIFSFELAEGSPDDALKAPNSIVLSAGAARRLFKNEDPIGKTIAFSDRQMTIFAGSTESGKPVSWGRFTITGVIADKGYKSHLQFDALMSQSSIPVLIAGKLMGDPANDWQNYFHAFTYALLKPGKTGKDLNASIETLAAATYSGLPGMKDFKMTAQKLTMISPGLILGNEPVIALPRVVYYFLSVLAFVIMLSACLNYTNLSIARALTRAKEIGIRKVNGAGRKNIVFQFLAESVLTALAALVMASLFLLLIRFAFLHLWVNQYLHFSLDSQPEIYWQFALFALLIGLVSGIYPALYLSGFQPVRVLRNFSGMRPGKLGMRKVLSVSQFVISLIFIISSILIFNQSMHFLKFNFEFNSKNIVNIDLQGNDYKSVSAALSSIAGVEKVSACDYLPATGRSEGTSIRKEGSKDEYQNVNVLQVDENFVNNLQLKLLAGKNLEANTAPGYYVLVNEAAVKALGSRFPADIVGVTLRSKYNDSVSMKVAGVVKNFHMNLDHDEILPLILQYQPGLFKYLNVRLASGNPGETVAKMERKWKQIDPTHSFRYQYFDDQLAATSQGFFDIVTILGFMAFLAVSIACLGLLGMATYTTERRLKEVGIRKILGANNSGIVLLLSQSFIRVLIWAISIAAPLSYILNTLWLRKFPNRVAFGLGTILSGTGILLLLGLVTIGSQTLRAARRNPVNALRTE